MALPQSALSDLLDAIRAGGADVLRDETVQIGRLPGRAKRTMTSLLGRARIQSSDLPTYRPGSECNSMANTEELEAAELASSVALHVALPASIDFDRVTVAAADTLVRRRDQRSWRRRIARPVPEGYSV